MESPLTAASFTALAAWANRPVSARAVRWSRVATGLTAAIWFARNLWTAPRYLAPDGILPRAVVEEIYGFAWQPLIRPEMPEVWPAALQALGLALALMLAAGRRPRTCAALLYVIAVCTYRRIFPLMYIDDGVIHLALLWQILLPHPRRADERWVPGAAVRLAAANMALIYLVAGTTKFASPMWRDGTALWAILRHPLAWWPEWMPAEPSLHGLTWAALAVEPMMLLVFVLPAFHRLKWPVLAGGLALHLGNIVLLDVAVANLACLALWPLVLHGELAPRGPPPPTAARWSRSARAAAVVVATLIPAMGLASVSGGWRTPSFEATPPAHVATAEAGGTVQTVLYGALWIVGLAQSYRLLDWIDERDAVILRRTFETSGPAVDVDAVLERSARGTVVLSYLMGMTWTPLQPPQRRALRSALAEGIARRACAVATGGASEAPWHGLLVVEVGRSARPGGLPGRFELGLDCIGGRLAAFTVEPPEPDVIGRSVPIGPR